MNITLQRRPSTQHCTLGELSIDGVFECFTLEDVVREVAGEPAADWKIAGETAIPAGRYQVIVNHSAHFGRDLPLLLKVPGFEGIRIHPGNDDKDTEGCILVGKRILGEAIADSRDAFAPLFQTITEALANGEEVWLEVGGDNVPA